MKPPANGLPATSDESELTSTTETSRFVYSHKHADSTQQDVWKAERSQVAQLDSKASVCMLAVSFIWIPLKCLSSIYVQDFNKMAENIQEKVFFPEAPVLEI